MPDRLNTQHVTQRQNFLANPTPRRIGAGGELFACRKNGEEFPVEIGLSPIETEEGRMVLASVVDVTERRRTMEELERRAVALNTEVAQRRVIELELRETSENFRYLFQHSPLPMWVFDIGDFRFLEVNDAAVLQYGFSRDEFLTMSILDIRPAEEQSRLKQNLATETAAYQQSTNWRHRRKNGEIIQVDIFTHALLFEGRSARMTVAIDVTKRNQAEEQLRQAQKMDAMGQLTGGISHDFNNLLAIIQGNVELIADHVAADPAVMEMAADVLKATERGATLTQQLLAYSRQQPLEPRVLILGKTIADLTTMLVRLLGETIQVETNVAADLWKVRIDPHQLENALLNLALNARDAMPTGGKLTIEARNTTLDEHYAAENADVTPGNYVLVAVSDTGSGMSSETIGRAFEPFFTTKAVGRGTGLGLSMVYGFVKQSGGHIKIYSELTHGTSIKLYLPSATENVAAQEITEMDGQVPQSMSGEVVLVVEDDAAVRKLAVRLLIGLGYQTIEAEDGPNALVVLENTQRIDLLFTDVVMPKGMSGPVLAREAQLRRPGLKVLYMSGYTRDAMLHNGEVSEGIHLISKPFRKVELATKLRQILDGQDAD